MELKIGGKDYKLYFGIDFIREMDKRYAIEENGFKFGVGLQSAVVHLFNRNVVVLEDIILSATHTLKSIPSKADIEEFLTDLEDWDGLFDDFLEKLRVSPMTTRVAKKLIDEMMKEKEQ